jgi:putative transposase/transposase-like zinc-binding protein
MDTVEAQRTCERRGMAYRRREPEKTLLFQIVTRHLEPFLAKAADLADGRGLPRFVERELRAFLRCGIVEHGFVRVHCDTCGGDILVAFSCKGRGFCPSCGGRRMADTAAHLVDRVLPRVPVRQWVFTVPIHVRRLIAFDRELARRVRNIFVRAVLGWMRRRGRSAGVVFPQVGAVTAVQRFGSALNLNVHFHTLVLDGVFRTRWRGREFRFVLLQAPSDQELERLLSVIRARVFGLLRRRGRLHADEDDADSSDGDDSPSFRACVAASLVHRIALGSQSGQPLARRNSSGLVTISTFPKPGCVAQDGFTLHANVRVAARDRGRLERLCRYLFRPPVSDARLALNAQGKIELALKTPYSDGTTHLILEPMTFLERLAALVPPPRAHLVVYHGILASAAATRRDVIPYSFVEVVRTAGEAAATESESDATADDNPVIRSAPRSRNYTWAELMKRVFLIDVLQCPCGGTRRLIASITEPAIIIRILRCLGLADSSSERAPPEVLPLASPDRPGTDRQEVRLVIE